MGALVLTVLRVVAEEDSHVNRAGVLPPELGYWTLPGTLAGGVRGVWDDGWGAGTMLQSTLNIQQYFF